MSVELLPGYIFDKDFCHFCEREEKDMTFDHNDFLICSFCQEKMKELVYNMDQEMKLEVRI